MVKYSETSCESTYDGKVTCKFKWSIPDFTSIQETCVHSPTFSACDCNETEWSLAAYPTGLQNNGFVSIFHLIKSSNKPEIHADYTIAFLNVEGKIHPKLVQKGTDCFQSACKSTRGWEFIKKSDLVNYAEHLLPDGNLTILCEIILEGGPINKSKLQSKKIVENLGKLLSSKKFTDVNLLVGDKEIEAHKVLLANMSSVFADLFEQSHGQWNRFIINDVDYETMVEVLEFIYTGKTSKLNEMAEKLLLAAEKFALADLKELCENALCEQLTIENACGTLIFFDAQSCNRSKQKVKKFIIENVAEVVKTKGYTQMTQPHLIKGSS